MKILHVSPFYEPFWAYGGMARSSSALCRALVRRGHEVRVVTALLGEGPPLEESMDGVAVRRFHGPRLLRRFRVPWAWGLGDFLRQELGVFDIAHLHGHRNGLAVTTSRALMAARRPWVLVTAGTFPHHDQYRWVKAVFDRWAGRDIVQDAAALVAVSRSEARDLPKPALVIPNGVDVCGTASKAPAAGRRRILFVGSDSKQKRGHVLVKLVSALPRAELHLVGPFGSSFVRRFASLEGRVTFRGVLTGDALAGAYASADVLVHPAVGEAFGLVPFEAALAGTPAVVAGGHGCGEWYALAGGCVVPADDPAALADAVAARLADPALGKREAESVAAFARTRLTWDKAAEQFEGLYQDVGKRRS
jgi:glycosyltransferase involved in cell wall biosynthesis